MSLSGNTEKINTLISKINALPEAGSGGGGSGVQPDICIVAIMDNRMEADLGVNLYTALCYENGEYVWKSEANVDMYNTVIENVVLGSVVTVDVRSHTIEVGDGAEEIAASANTTTRSFKITANPGDVAIIMCNDDE